MHRPESQRMGHSIEGDNAHMNSSDVEAHYKYNDWANERMLGVIRNLTDGQYTQALVSSFPTIRDTWAHMVFAEWLWLQRWNGDSPRVGPEWSSNPPDDRLAAVLHEIEENRRRFLSTLDDASLHRPLNYNNTKGDPFSTRFLDVLLHVVNHASYHRGQLTTMIRQVGATPVTTDLIVYVRPPALP